MDSSSFVMILLHLAFEKNLKVDFLLFRVVEDNMGVVFHFAFVLVGTSLQSLGFVAELVGKIYYLGFVVEFVYLLVVEKKFYDMYVVSVFLVHDILDYRV